MKDELFNNWHFVKGKLNAKQNQPPYVSVGDVWWAAVGQNIGIEINGKCSQFSRPVIIYRKLSKHLYWCIPLTTQSKLGDWYQPLMIKNKVMNACIHQIRSLDYRRLLSKIGQVNNHQLLEIETCFKHLQQKNMSRPQSKEHRSRSRGKSRNTPIEELIQSILSAEKNQ